MEEEKEEGWEKIERAGRMHKKSDQEPKMKRYKMSLSMQKHTHTSTKVRTHTFKKIMYTQYLFKHTKETHVYDKDIYVR